MSKHDREKFDLEGELGAARPRAPRRFIAALAASAGSARSGFRGRRPLTVALVGAASLAVMGGIGFAASSAIESSQVAVKRVAADGAREIAVRNAASAAYVDPGRVQTVADGPKVTAEKYATTLVIKNDPDVTLRTSLTVNESGTLSVQVLRANGLPVNIDCKRSTVQSGSFPGTGEAKICRVVINTPTTLEIQIKVPSRQLNPGEELTIRLGYRDRDAHPTRKFATTRATVPRLPTVTRDFALSPTNIDDIRTALADGSGVEVTFKAWVTNNRGLSITWGTAPAETASTTVTRNYLREADVPRRVTVTVTGSEIGGGDFTITDIVEPEAQTILIIDGARNGDRIEVFGTATGFEMGAILHPWIRFPGQTGFSMGTAQILVDDQGEWNWGRNTGKRTAVQIRNHDGSVRSNTVIIEAR